MDCYRFVPLMLLMIRYLLLALAIYVAYKIIFDVILPIFTASRQMHRQFRTMQQQMHEHMNAQQHQQHSSANTTATPQQKKTPSGDYIDFEEVK